MFIPTVFWFTSPARLTSISTRRSASHTRTPDRRRAASFPTGSTSTASCSPTSSARTATGRTRARRGSVLASAADASSSSQMSADSRNDVRDRRRGRSTSSTPSRHGAASDGTTICRHRRTFPRRRTATSRWLASRQPTTRPSTTGSCIMSDAGRRLVPTR